MVPFAMTFVFRLVFSPKCVYALVNDLSNMEDVMHAASSANSLYIIIMFLFYFQALVYIY